jgi:predicted AAA+ superfamily ATPase
METRDLYVRTWQDLAREKNMVFLVGPRQVGKTTLSKIISEAYTNNLYFNWDDPLNRTRLIKNPFFFEELVRKDPSPPLVIFDEIHKYRDWKNYLKGVYDKFHSGYRFLVSGSGRLDIYQKGGDSLAGRYYLFHLWPFTIAELGTVNKEIEVFLKDPLDISLKGSEALRERWNRLSTLSGFPEPYLANRVTTYRRWTTTYSSQLIREDIRDLTGIRSIGQIETLYFLLPSKVGSPVSIPSLAADLKVSYNTVMNWLSAFERFFLTFSITPWSKRIARAIQKERKVYMFDTPRVEDPGARFENMIALELWRAVTNWNDLGHGQFSLHFVKNKEKQEVDFLIANNRKPFLLIEAKLSESTPTVPLRKFQSSLNIPAVQLNEEAEGYRLFSNNGQSILVAPAYQWLSQLP